MATLSSILYPLSSLLGYIGAGSLALCIVYLVIFAWSLWDDRRRGLTYGVCRQCGWTERELACIGVFFVDSGHTLCSSCVDAFGDHDLDNVFAGVGPMNARGGGKRPTPNGPSRTGKHPTSNFGEDE